MLDMIIPDNLFNNGGNEAYKSFAFDISKEELTKYHNKLCESGNATGNLNFAIGEQVIRELTRAAKGKTLIAVTHDDRLAPYFDHVIDMNAVTSGMYDAPNGAAVKGGDAE